MSESECIPLILHRLLSRHLSVLRYLESDRVEVSWMVKAERDLLGEIESVLAELAQTTEQLLQVDDLMCCIGELRLAGSEEPSLARRCRELIGKLCSAPEVDHLLFDVICEFAELSRIVWALRLLDSKLARNGPQWALKVVEGVRSNLSRKAEAGLQLDDAAILASARLTLQRIRLSPVCSGGSAQSATVLLAGLQKEAASSRPALSVLSSQLENLLAPERPAPLGAPRPSGTRVYCGIRK